LRFERRDENRERAPGGESRLRADCTPSGTRSGDDTSTHRLVVGRPLPFSLPEVRDDATSRPRNQGVSGGRARRWTAPVGAVHPCRRVAAATARLLPHRLPEGVARATERLVRRTQPDVGAEGGEDEDDRTG